LCEILRVVPVVLESRDACPYQAVKPRHRLLTAPRLPARLCGLFDTHYDIAPAIGASGSLLFRNVLLDHSRQLP
jgi:hypothetical protein